MTCRAEPSAPTPALDAVSSGGDSRAGSVGIGGNRRTLGTRHASTAERGNDEMGDTQPDRASVARAATSGRAMAARSDDPVSDVLPGWAWRNPPIPPIGCTTCEAAAGARCTAVSGADAGRGHRTLPTARIHKARAMRVKAWYDRYDGQRAASNVVDFGLERARRRNHAGARIVTPSG